MNTNKFANGKIRITVVDCENNVVLEDLGNCLTDSPNRALEMYQDDEDKWTEKGYSAELRWNWIDTSQAASTLGKMTSDRKAASSRENGKKGGRPHKDCTAWACGYHGATIEIGYGSKSGLIQEARRTLGSGWEVHISEITRDERNGTISIDEVKVFKIR